MATPTDVTSCVVCKQEYTLSHQWPHPYCPECQLAALESIRDIRGVGINPLAQAHFEQKLERARRDAKPDKRKPEEARRDAFDSFANASGYQPPDSFAGLGFPDYFALTKPKLLDPYPEHVHSAPEPVVRKYDPLVKTLTGTRTQERIAAATPEPEWPFENWGAMGEEEADKEVF